MLIIGHRGASGYAPENTLKAFKLAFEHNADGIECDIIQHASQCYVMHDQRLDRTTNSNGLLTEYSHKELATFDAGEGETIPTLAQLITCIPTGKWCNLELKYIDDINGFIEALRSLVTQHLITEKQLLISSFNHQWLDAIQNVWPELPIAYLIAHYPLNPEHYFQSLNTNTVNVALDIVDENLVKAAHTTNKKILIYTVNDPEDIRRCKQIGADGIFTNYPLLAKEIN